MQSDAIDFYTCATLTAVLKLIMPLGCTWCSLLRRRPTSEVKVTKTSTELKKKASVLIITHQFSAHLSIYSYSGKVIKKNAGKIQFGYDSWTDA